MNVVVQLLSGAWVFVTPRTVALKVSLSSTISWSLFEFLSFESLMSTNHLILCCPLLLLPLIFPLLRVFSNESTLHIRRSKYLRFSISLSSGYSGLIFLKFSSVPQSHPTLCDTMDCSMTVFSVYHQPSDLAQMHVNQMVMLSNHFILCRSLLLPSIFGSFFPMSIQDRFPSWLTSLISLQSKGLSRVCSNTTAQQRQYWGAQLSLWSKCHIHTWLLEKP